MRPYISELASRLLSDREASRQLKRVLRSEDPKQDDKVTFTDPDTKERVTVTVRKI